MLFNIPQFIDKEDKIVGPFTARQMGWMFGAGATLLVLWVFYDLTAFILLAVPVVAVFGALAFYRPNGQPLIAFIFSSIAFLFRPKMYTWRRIPEPIRTKEKQKKQAVTFKDERVLNEDKIDELSNLLDNRKK